MSSVEVRLEEVLKMIAENHGYRLLAARVYRGDHVHVFVSDKPMVCISVIVAVLIYAVMFLEYLKCIFRLYL